MDRAEVYLEHIRRLLRDNKVPPLEGELAEDPLLQQIHDELKTIREVMLSFSAGDFSPSIGIRGIIPGCLKALQAHLRHLVWQVQMVEKGDFTQEVRFMGEFSTAFNSMVKMFNSTLSSLRQKEEELMATNNKLRGEVDRRASTVEALKESEARFKFLANHDPLTGILNRRSFIERAGIKLQSAAEQAVPCCLVMMDIDHFKRFNDTYGHLAGDKALRHVTKTIETKLRKDDFMGRYGGEEFLFFFYAADKETGVRVVERIRKGLEETPVDLENEAVHVYASFGVVESFMEAPTGPDYVQKLINDSDAALYTAKRAGRNRVVLYSPEQTEQFEGSIPVVQEIVEVEA